MFWNYARAWMCDGDVCGWASDEFLTYANMRRGGVYVIRVTAVYDGLYLAPLQRTVHFSYAKLSICSLRNSRCQRGRTAV